MFVITFLSIFVIAVLYFFQYFKERQRRFKPLDEVPGPTAYPLIGNSWMFLLIPKHERIDFLKGLYQSYGSLFKMWLGPIPVVLVSDAEDAEIIFSSRVNIEKPILYKFLESWLGTGLLVSSGSKWHQRRKLLTPAFHFSILESFLPVMIEHNKVFIEKLKPLENKGDLNIYPYINKYTLDVICETAMGVKLDIQKSETSEYLESVEKITDIVMKRAFRPWWYLDRLYCFSSLYRKERAAIKVLHSMSMNVIQQNRQKRKEKKINADTDEASDNHERKNRKAFLDLLLDISESSQIPLSDEDIREEVDTFMFEGHDTTASGLTSTVYLLSKHQDVQDKVAEELYSVFGNSDRDPTLQDLSQLKYLECVIKEGLRLFPPVPLLARHISENIKLGGKYVIPPGTIVLMNLFRLHRLSSQYEKPDDFYPDHFLYENSRDRHPFTYVPFSAGQRNCIGQKFAMLEEKVFFSSLLRNYEIKPPQKISELNINVELIVRFSGGVRVNIAPRIWKNIEHE